jgi:hypothetical protein
VWRCSDDTSLYIRFLICHRLSPIPRISFTRGPNVTLGNEIRGISTRGNEISGKCNFLEMRFGEILLRGNQIRGYVTRGTEIRENVIGEMRFGTVIFTSIFTPI